MAIINLQSDKAVTIIQKTNQKIDSLQNELNKELQYKTQGVVLRSKVRWYSEGEQNSKFFFSLEKNRSRNKQMFATKRHDGSVIHDSRKILLEQSKF